jgi:hypothetical protein
MERGYKVYLIFTIMKPTVPVDALQEMVGIKPDECLAAGGIRILRGGQRYVLSECSWRISLGPTSDEAPVPLLWQQMRDRLVGLNYSLVSSFAIGVPFFSIIVYEFEYFPPIIIPVDFVDTAARMNAEIEVDIYSCRE